MLIQNRESEEAMRMLLPMLESDNISDIQGALWVLAKDETFNIYDFLQNKLRQTPSFLSNINEILATYNRVKFELMNWRQKDIADTKKDSSEAV